MKKINYLLLTSALSCPIVAYSTESTEESNGDLLPNMVLDSYGIPDSYGISDLYEVSDLPVQTQRNYLSYSNSFQLIDIWIDAISSENTKDATEILETVLNKKENDQDRVIFFNELTSYFQEISSRKPESNNVLLHQVIKCGVDYPELSGFGAITKASKHTREDILRDAADKDLIFLLEGLLSQRDANSYKINDVFESLEVLAKNEKITPKIISKVLNHPDFNKIKKEYLYNILYYSLKKDFTALNSRLINIPKFSDLNYLEVGDLLSSALTGNNLEAIEKLLNHPTAKNLPADLIGQNIVKTTFYGMELFTKQLLAFENAANIKSDCIGESLLNALNENLIDVVTQLKNLPQAKNLSEYYIGKIINKGYELSNNDIISFVLVQENFKNVSTDYLGTILPLAIREGHNPVYSVILNHLNAKTIQTNELEESIKQALLRRSMITNQNKEVLSLASGIFLSGFENIKNISQEKIYELTSMAIAYKDLGAVEHLIALENFSKLDTKTIGILLKALLDDEYFDLFDKTLAYEKSQSIPQEYLVYFIQQNILKNKSAILEKLLSTKTAKDLPLANIRNISFSLFLYNHDKALNLILSLPNANDLTTEYMVEVVKAALKRKNSEFIHSLLRYKNLQNASQEQIETLLVEAAAYDCADTFDALLRLEGAQNLVAEKEAIRQKGIERGPFKELKVFYDIEHDTVAPFKEYNDILESTESSYPHPSERSLFVWRNLNVLNKITVEDSKYVIRSKITEGELKGNDQIQSVTSENLVTHICAIIDKALPIHHYGVVKMLIDHARSEVFSEAQKDKLVALIPADYYAGVKVGEVPAEEIQTEEYSTQEIDEENMI